MKRMLAVVAAAGFVLGGCGTAKEAAKDTAGSPTSSTPAASTPAPTTAAPTTPTPTKPATLTREQAGQRYLTLIKPVNAVFDDPKCMESEEIFISGGTWPNDHPDRVVRACFKRYVPLLEGFIKALRTTAWPVDARADVADMISIDQAYLHCAKKASRAATYEAMSEVYAGCFPEDDGSADRVRARFGLPGRSPS